MVEKFASPYLGVFTIGLIYGLTYCSFICLPYLGTYIMATQEGFKKGLRSTLIFISARIITYTSLGGVCGYLGRTALEKIDPKQTLFTFGSVIIVIGLLVFFNPREYCPTSNRVRGNCSSIENNPIKEGYPGNRAITERIKFWPYNSDIHLFTMGVGISLIPCGPLSAILLYSAANHSILGGGGIALSFGLGTSISPILIMSGLAGWLSKRIAEEIPQHKRLLQRICGMILILLGMRTILA